eukprot:CAMPEP_0182492270 /NCGR_PEP_ID=MMETSP1321-20130603/1465_1 /TAXON_ID=91990 /ORGANISM="Bolidomonas sp., Strain RCC1657" /LENGTH=65 /DNA_ID=CAMNT_0024694719 /DNA_START=120 /DNA_END=317 /DNA_ORIENTATION=+
MKYLNRCLLINVINHVNHTLNNVLLVVLLVPDEYDLVAGGVLGLVGTAGLGFRYLRLLRGLTGGG